MTLSGDPLVAACHCANFWVFDCKFGNFSENSEITDLVLAMQNPLLFRVNLSLITVAFDSSRCRNFACSCNRLVSVCFLLVWAFFVCCSSTSCFLLCFLWFLFCLEAHRMSVCMYKEVCNNTGVEYTATFRAHNTLSSTENLQREDHNKNQNKKTTENTTTQYNLCTTVKWPQFKWHSAWLWLLLSKNQKRQPGNQRTKWIHPRLQMPAKNNNILTLTLARQEYQQENGCRTSRCKEKHIAMKSQEDRHYNR